MCISSSHILICVYWRYGQNFKLITWNNYSVFYSKLTTLNFVPSNAHGKQNEHEGKQETFGRECKRATDGMRLHRDERERERDRQSSREVLFHKRQTLSFNKSFIVYSFIPPLHYIQRLVFSNSFWNPTIYIINLQPHWYKWIIFNRSKSY